MLVVSWMGNLELLDLAYLAEVVVVGEIPGDHRDNVVVVAILQLVWLSDEE